MKADCSAKIWLCYLARAGFGVEVKNEDSVRHQNQSLLDKTLNISIQNNQSYREQREYSSDNIPHQAWQQQGTGHQSRPFLFCCGAFSAQERNDKGSTTTARSPVGIAIQARRVRAELKLCIS